MPHNKFHVLFPNAGLYAPFPYRYVDSTRDPGNMPVEQRDLVYINQMGSANPQSLDATSFRASGILDRWLSFTISRQLTKIGVLDEQGMIHTDKIDRHFRDHLAEIGAFRQKQIVDMLFWWEEEVMRLKKLEAEKQELQQAITATTDADERTLFTQMLGRVDGKIHARPSGRDEAVEKNEDELIVRFRTNFINPQSGQNSETVIGEHEGEELPPYTER